MNEKEQRPWEGKMDMRITSPIEEAHSSVVHPESVSRRSTSPSSSGIRVAPLARLFGVAPPPQP
jgi:hypothetical protein